MSRHWRILVCLAAAVLLSCAQGEIDANNGGGSNNGADDTASGSDVLDAESDTGDTTADGDTGVLPDTADTDATDTGGSVDTSDTGGGDDVGDTGATDTKSTDSSGSDTSDTTDTGGDPCGGCSSGVCNTSTGQCVDCMGDSDCSGGDVCRTSDNVCVECMGDGDCSGGALCHDEHPVCVPTCCTETVQDAFVSDQYFHNHFDLGLTSSDEPYLVYADDDNDEILFAQLTGGQWLSQAIPNTSTGTSGLYIRMAVDPTTDNPHIIVGRYESLKHYWRTSSGWQEVRLHDMLTPAVSSVSYVDIDVDSNGTVHMIALLGYGDRVVYFSRNSQGQVAHENLTLPSTGDGIPVWTNIGVTTDGRPIVSFEMGTDDVIVVGERSSGGTWSYETPVQDSAQVHGMDVGPDDHPKIIYRRTENYDGLRLAERTSQTWNDTLVVDNAATNVEPGYSPDIDIDDLGDPHVTYMASDPSGQYVNPMFYLRWNGNDWETYQINGIDRAFYPRILVDSMRTAHMAVYDPPSDAISYVHLTP